MHRKTKNHFRNLSLPIAVVAAIVAVLLSNFQLSAKHANSAGLNLLVIYGHITSFGGITDGSGNFTVSNSGSGIYDIAFTAASGFTAPPSVVAMGENSGAGAIVTIVEAPTTTGVRIRTGHGSSGQFNGAFDFIAMGQSAAPSTNLNVIYGSINGGRGGYGTPGAMINRGSGGWTSYLGFGITYQVSFSAGVFSQTPTVVASEEINGPVDCVIYDTGSTNIWGVSLRSMTDGCRGTQYSWGSINFIAVGVGTPASPNLAIAQGTWTRNGVSMGIPALNPGYTGISTVSNGSAGWPSQYTGFTVNFNPGTFADTPIVITNVSTPSWAPSFCAGPYAPSPWGTSISFTGIPWSWNCTYGDDRSGVYAHSTFGATMIAAGYAPVPPLLASCIAAASPIPYGTSATFNANTSGGTPPYTYQWLYPFGAASCGSVTTCSTNPLTSSLGPGTFTLVVHDSAGSQSNYAACPAIDVPLPSVVGSSFSAAAKQLTVVASTSPGTPLPVPVFVRNIGVPSSLMDWSCNVDPSYVLPPGLTVDTSTCLGFGLRGGAPPFP